MNCKQIEIPMPWGHVRGQIFGDQKEALPILGIHGFMDNSNSFKPLSSYVCKSKEYYLIAIDLPGQGLSDKIPDPSLYNFKILIYCIRKIVLYFKLKNFTFLTHSFGCTLAMMYSSCYPDDANSIVLLDFVFNKSISNKEIAINYRDAITLLLNDENSKETAKNLTQKELTYDQALERILKANRHIDELSGKILLERSLIYKEGKLEFSRDINLPKYFPIQCHYVEFSNFHESILKNVKSSILHIYAYPYPFGEEVFNFIKDFLYKIKASSNINLEMAQIKGLHHFHMIDPKPVSELILEFLKKENKVNSKL